MFKMKAIAAVAALVAATGANAAYNFNDPVAGNPDLLLAVISADASKSAIFDLGAMGDFANFASAAAKTTIRWNLNTNTATAVAGTGFGSGNWSDALADFGSLAGARYAVIAGDRVGSATTNQRYWSTTNSTEAQIEVLNNQKLGGFNAVASGINGALIKDGHLNNANGASTAVAGDVDHLPDAFFNVDVDWKVSNFEAFALVGTELNFYALNGKGTASTAKINADQYQYKFKLSETGVLAVPEADTYAMLLAGLGMVGLMARRRRVI